jgi:hypothetical protein
MHPTASWAVVGGVSAVAIGVALAVVVAHTRQARADGASPWPFALGVVGWLAATFGLAAGGLFTRWSLRPPPFVLLAVGSIVATVLVSRSSVGRRLAALPAWVLVGFASFRLPLELVMHAAAAEGTMPRQMTFGAGGYNYDIVTGVTALAVAMFLFRRQNLALLRAWNLMGLALLIAIVTVAFVSTPAIAAFGPARLNTWIAYAPFVWMIAINVPAALLGHLVIFRKLGAAAQPTTSYSASLAM